MCFYLIRLHMHPATCTHVLRGLRMLFSKEPVPLLQVAQRCKGQHIWQLGPAGLLGCLSLCCWPPMPLTHEPPDGSKTQQITSQPGSWLPAAGPHFPCSIPSDSPHTYLTQTQAGSSFPQIPTLHPGFLGSPLLSSLLPISGPS